MLRFAKVIRTCSWRLEPGVTAYRFLPRSVAPEEVAPCLFRVRGQSRLPRLKDRGPIEAGRESRRWGTNHITVYLNEELP